LSVLSLISFLLACPIRYWPFDPLGDNTWVFALNYAAAHGLAIGRDVVWTTGPLGYLVFPQDVGHNLTHALIFQSVVWALLIAILADLFFRSGFPLRKLGFFTLLFALSAPLYWFNYTGMENLLLMGSLVLLVVVRSRGGLVRYVTALALCGVVPLIKLTGAMIAAGALAGYLADRIIRLRRNCWPQVVLGITIPLGVFAAGCWCTLPSWDAFVTYMKASVSLAANYSIAMSTSGSPLHWIAAAEVIVLIALALLEAARSSRQLAAFSSALVAIPLFFALKHGFVREDVHILNFFGFASLALALIVLGTPLAERSLRILVLIVLGVATISMAVLCAWKDPEGLQEVTGIRSALFTWRALSFNQVPSALRSRSMSNFQPGDRLDPAIRQIIGDSPVATLSISCSYAALDGLNLRLYPVIQRYAAYTPYLDRLNATWVRDKGPRFLIVEWAAIDDRHPWVETPAMWAEIYRWYNTRASESWSVLLERRPSPRFDHFEPIRHFQQPFRGTLDMPESPDAIFWTMECHPNLTGRLLKFLFRVPESGMTIDEADGDRDHYRIIPEVLASPVMGNDLPNSDEELAELLDPASTPKKLVTRFTFGGPGIASYDATCDATLLRPVL
jgi:hypothetical protein